MKALNSNTINIDELYLISKRKESKYWIQSRNCFLIVLALEAFFPFKIASRNFSCPSWVSVHEYDNKVMLKKKTKFKWYYWGSKTVVFNNRIHLRICFHRELFEAVSLVSTGLVQFT